MVGEDGFEPSKRNVTDLQSAPFGLSGTPPFMELAIGIEPTTCWLQVSCSTVEPCQHIITKKLFYFHFKFKWRLRRGSNPRPLAWQASTLTNWATEPHLWWKQQGSNLWPSACKADALPAELCFHIKWWPLGESNPCYHRERVVSWPLDQGA